MKIFEEMTDSLHAMSEIDQFCYAYFRKTGSYLSDPSPQEIWDLIRSYPYHESVEKEFSLSSPPSREKIKQMESFFHLESLFFDDGNDIMVTRSIRYFVMIEHSHNYFEIECVLDGNAAHSSGEHTITLSEGDMVLIPPGTKHNLIVDGNSTVLNIGIRHSTFQSAFFDILNSPLSISKYFQSALYGAQNNEIFFRKGMDPFARELVLMICRCQHRKTPEANPLSVHLTQSLLYYLAGNSKEHSVFNISEYFHSEAMEIKMYIILHYRDITLEALAQHFSFSPSYMSRLIKKYFGISYSQLLQSIRLEKACELLQNTDMSITDVCSQIGYENESYFIKIFHNTFHTTPYRYRKGK